MKFKKTVSFPYLYNHHLQGITLNCKVPQLHNLRNWNIDSQSENGTLILLSKNRAPEFEN